MVWIVMVLIVMALDQASKVWVVGNLPLHVPQPFFPGVLQLTYIHNRGAAFGIMQNRQYLFIIAALAVSILLLYFRRDLTQGKTLLKVALALVISGALGNLIDRIVRGYVVDFLETTFMVFPVFNIADSAIVIGVTLFIVDLVWDMVRPIPKAG